MSTSLSTSHARRHSQQVSSKQDLNWAIGWNRVILKIFGLWIYPDQSPLRDALSHVHTTLIALSIFIFLIFPQTTALVKVWGIPALIVDNIAYNLPVSSAELKLLILWYKKKDVASVFVLIGKDWLNEKSNRERDVMMKYAKISRMLTIGGLLGSVATTTSYHIPLTWNTVVRTLNNITDVPGVILAVQTVYIYDVTPPIIYRFTIISQYIGTVFASLIYTGVDVLFSMFVMHLCGQLESLSHRIRTMADKRQNFQDRLKINVELHCSLIKYAETTEDIFSLMVLALVILFSIIFCLESFTLISIFSDATEIPIAQVAFYISFTMYFLFLMFVYSWVGENLVTHSMSLHEAAYNCTWTSLPPKEFVQITLILIRSKKPLHITAGRFAPVTLNTFVSICRTSCGWLSVLLAMKN